MTAEALTTSRWRTPLLCAAATFAAFAKTLAFPFVNWQDPVLILGPASTGSVSWLSAWKAVSDLSATPYQPITQFVYAIIVSLAGVDPAAFHAVNVGLHVVVAILAYWLLLRWDLGHVPAVIGALFFSLHPLRVEAVAWASGMSEILATLFVLISALSWFRYRSEGRVSWYAVALVSGIVAMGSSVTAAPWPFVLLMIDRPSSSRSMQQRTAEVAPFMLFGLTVVAIAIAPWIAGAIANGIPDITLTNVAAYPSSALLFHIWQSIAPGRLTVVYVLPLLGAWWWLVMVVLAVIVGFVWRLANKGEPYRVGLAWILFFLLPAATGVLDDPGPISDRSTMLPSIGLALIVGTAVQWLLRRDQGRFARPVKVASVLMLAIFGTLSSIQSETWSSSTSLWTAATDRSPTSALAHNLLGAALAQESGDLLRAEQSFTIALHHDTSMAAAYANRGATRAALGRIDEGLRDLNEALRLDTHDAGTRMLRASILRRSGRLDEALRDMNTALAAEPMNAAWMAERMELLLEMGRTGEAAVEAEVLRKAGYDVRVEGRRSADPR